jgi:hypothetical protein
MGHPALERHAMKLRPLFFFLGLALVARLGAAESPTATVVVVAGAAGEEEYGGVFAELIETWGKVCAQAKAKRIAIGTDGSGEKSDHDRLKEALEAEVKEGPAELWIVLIGHGTFDGKEAKFNLRGPDVASSELVEWLKPFKRPVAVIDTSSSSAPFLVRLTAPGRVVISSTRSGQEQNYARFGKYFTEAIADLKSDLDKDGQVSLLEAFLGGSQRTAEFYKTEGRLATEHALIDDNGDGLGTPGDWFRGVRATKQARDGATLDGTRAHQFHLVRSADEQQLTTEARARRDLIEVKISRLREAKAKLPEDRYYQELEKLLLELAALYEGT